MKQVEEASVCWFGCLWKARQDFQRGEFRSGAEIHKSFLGWCGVC